MKAVWQLYTVTAACGLMLKGRGHSNYWLCHQSMMKVLLAWRVSCSNMRLRQFKHCEVLQGGTVDCEQSPECFFIVCCHFFSACRWKKGLTAMIKSNLGGNRLLKSVIIISRESSVSVLNSVTKLNCNELRRNGFSY